MACFRNKQTHDCMLLFADKGGRLTPTYATKKGTRYRCYVSMGLVTGAKTNRSNGVRLPAGNLEGMVIDRLRAFLNDPAALLDAPCARVSARSVTSKASTSS